MILGTADGAVAIDRMGDRGADIGVSDGAHAVGEHVRFVESADPQIPIFAAHYRFSVGDLLVAGRLDIDIRDLAALHIDGLVAIGLANGFEDRTEAFAGAGVGASCSFNKPDWTSATSASCVFRPCMKVTIIVVH